MQVRIERSRDVLRCSIERFKSAGVNISWLLGNRMVANSLAYLKYAKFGSDLAHVHPERWKLQSLCVNHCRQTGHGLNPSRKRQGGKYSTFLYRQFVSFNVLKFEI